MELETRDSLDRMLDSSTLPPFCPSELDDLLKLFSSAPAPSSTRPGATPFAHSTPPVPPPDAVAAAHGLAPIIPANPPPLLGGPANHPIPPRRSSWAGNASASAQAFGEPLAQFPSAGAAIMAMASPFGAPQSSNSGGGEGSSRDGSPVEAHSATGGSNGGNESIDEGREVGGISFKPAAQMFISGAPFVFRGVGGEEEGGEGPGGGGGAAGSSRRVQARKERNRRAQRTFRQRQKHKMADLEAEVAELGARMNALRSSNAQLSSSVSLLNKVLEVREEQLLDVQRKEADADRRDREAASASRGLQQLCQEEPLYLSAYTQNEQPVRMTEEFASQMTPEIGHAIWMVYGREVSECIKLLAPSTHHLKSRVVQLVHELKKCMTLLIHLNPENFAKVRKIAEAACPPGYTAVRMMKEVVSALELTPQMKRAIVDKWKWLQAEQRRVAAETKDLNAQFTACLPTQTSTGPISQEYLCNHNRVEKMGKLLKQFHGAKMEYMQYIICEVLTPLQLGRLISVCFPMMPNTLNLGDILAREMGENPNEPSIEVQPSQLTPQWMDMPDGFGCGPHNSCELTPSNCSLELMNPSSLCDDLGHRIIQPGK
ncbi:unnamed protein product [Ostreobium quekettii]|uniref:BZIP domain-containing protein n=1 Tax=Ostreobium quekettii TaxID=121088 RepID=A0A8S1J1K5_9CHLO|nr:unnamed protein product [Ostreobium quekettii]